MQGFDQAFVFDEFLKSANQAFVNALTKFLLPDGDKQKGPMVEALRAVIMTPSLTKLRQGDFSDWTTSWNYTELAADQPAVHLWVQILDIFEGAGQSGVNSFYGQLTAAVASCNPNKGGTYTEVDSQLRHVLTQLVTASGGNAQKMADTLQAEMRLEAMRRLRRNPAEGKAWSDAIAIVVRAQASNRGVLTMAQTDEAARAARSLIEQGQGADPNQGNAKTKTKHDEILRVLKSMIKGKKASGTSDRPDCSICGKKHAGGAAACWQRPSGGTTAFPWLADDRDSRPLCEALAAQGVLLAPGDCFGHPGHMRIGFAQQAEDFDIALARIAAALDRL